MVTVKCPHCGDEIDAGTAIDDSVNNIELESVDCDYYRAEVECECSGCGRSVLLNLELHMVGVTAYPWDEEAGCYDCDRSTESE